MLLVWLDRAAAATCCITCALNGSTGRLVDHVALAVALGAFVCENARNRSVGKEVPVTRRFELARIAHQLTSATTAASPQSNKALLSRLVFIEVTCFLHGMLQGGLCPDKKTW